MSYGRFTTFILVLNQMLIMSGCVQSLKLLFKYNTTWTKKIHIENSYHIIQCTGLYQIVYKNYLKMKKEEADQKYTKLILLFTLL